MKAIRISSYASKVEIQSVEHTFVNLLKMLSFPDDQYYFIRRSLKGHLIHSHNSSIVIGSFPVKVHMQLLQLDHAPLHVHAAHLKIVL